MAKLTKRSLGLGDGFTSNYKRDDLIQKLGHIEHRGVSLVEEICDHCCKYPGEADNYELDNICAACSVTQLREMLE